MASNRMHPPRGMFSYESQAQFREALSESPHPPLVDRGNVRSDEQARKDPSAASRRPPVPPEHTPAVTKPPRQDHKDPSAVPQRPPYLLNASLLRQTSLLGRIVRSLLQHQTGLLYLLNIPLRRQCRLLCRTRRTPLLHHPGRRYSQNIPLPRQTVLQILCPNQYLGRVHLR